MNQGCAVPTLTYKYTGLVEGGQSPTFTGLLATSATSSSAVGTYAITQGTLAATGDYTIVTFDPATLTVERLHGGRDHRRDEYQPDRCRHRRPDGGGRFRGEHPHHPA